MEHPFADIALARRLERTEARANAAFVEARARLEPQTGATWIEVAGAYAMFDGVASPLTQVFGLGVFGRVGEGELERIEQFFGERGAGVFLEQSPLMEPGLLQLLTGRGYRPVELSTVLYRPVVAFHVPEPSGAVAVDTNSAVAAQRAQVTAVEPQVLSAAPSSEPLPVHAAVHAAAAVAAPHTGAVAVRVIEAGEAEVWASTAAEGWSSESAELARFVLGIGRVSARSHGNICFLAELDGHPIAAGALSIGGERVALLAGASTIPSARRQGAQRALLEARLRYAAERGCDLAMMVAAPGSASQRNAEREGFRVAYTRVKFERVSG